MNWSLILLGIVALSSATYAANSYLIIVPNLLRVDYENQLSIFIVAASQPVEVKFELTVAQERLQAKTICKPGETRNATLSLLKEFPIGPGELIITGTDGLTFEEKRNVIVYDNRHVLLVQTSASTYRPQDIMEIRVVATNENLIPIENGELTVEIYDAALKLVGEFSRTPIRSGLTETIRFPIAEHPNTGTWLVSAIIGNTTSSVQVLVSRPVTPSFDLKAIFQRFLLRTDKTLHSVIEIDSDENIPIFGRGIIAIGQITEQETQPKDDEWRQWKSQQMEIAGRVELNYDLLSLFNVDVSKALAVQVYIQVTDLASGQDRIIRHIIPVFNRDVIYDIRPLQFQVGVNNEYEVIAKRPDGRPIKMEDMIVSVRMILGNEQGKQQEEKMVEIKDFYTRGRNDVCFFNLEFPENCIGVLMNITPLDEAGKIRGYRTRALPLMPIPPRHDGKLSIELLPSKVAPAHTNVNVPVVSSQISTVGRTSNFYIQLLPSKSVTKFERLPMSFILMNNGRIILTGEFHIEPTKECQTKPVREIRPEEQKPPTCIFNGTLPIEITREMIPYSTLLVYTFQPSFGFNLAESYRFSVAGLFQNPLTLNTTIVPFKPTEIVAADGSFMEVLELMQIHLSDKVQDKTRVELSFTGEPDSTVGLNVFQYDGILQGLSNEITKERLLQYLTNYEQVPFATMPTIPSGLEKRGKRQATSEVYIANGYQYTKVQFKSEAKTESEYHYTNVQSKNQENIGNRIDHTNVQSKSQKNTENGHSHTSIQSKNKEKTANGHYHTNVQYKNQKNTEKGHYHTNVPYKNQKNTANGYYHTNVQYKNQKNTEKGHYYTNVQSKNKENTANGHYHTNVQSKNKENTEKEHYLKNLQSKNQENTKTGNYYNGIESKVEQNTKTGNDNNRIESKVEENTKTASAFNRIESKIEEHAKIGYDYNRIESKIEENIKTGGAYNRIESKIEEHAKTESAFNRIDSKIEEHAKAESDFNRIESKSEENTKNRNDFSTRTISEEDEERQINRERMGYQVRYPVEKLVFGISSPGRPKSVEGDDIYMTSNMERLYGDLQNQSPLSSSYQSRKFQNSINQQDVSVSNNDFVIATSIPLVFTADSLVNSMPPKSSQEQNSDVQIGEEYGTPSWYEKMHTKFNSFSQEAFTFMQSGLCIISDFESLRIPMEMKDQNFTKLFSKFRPQSMMNEQSFSMRDEARQLLEEYISQEDLSIVTPPIMLEEQARIGYYRSIFFNTSYIGSQGTGKVVLPRTKPYSTWLAAGFALNKKSGLSIAQPIRLPTNRGLYILADCPRQVQTGERFLLTYGIKNYLGKDVRNVVVRIRATNNFDLMEQAKPEQVVSSDEKDYTITIPSMKSFALETRHMIVVAKRESVSPIVLEVESEFGGDYEILSVFVRESETQRQKRITRSSALIAKQKSYNRSVKETEPLSALRSVQLTTLSKNTNVELLERLERLERLLQDYKMETNSLVGIDRALVRLYRSLALRRHLNETFQTNSPLFHMTFDNITTAYQRLQLYSNYDGSYSFVSDEGTKYSSLYFTSLAFGAMISPMMPFRDNVTLNRTLNWILSRQQEDGSFNDNGSCFHDRFCSDQFRRESLTAIVLYSLTRENSSNCMPKFIYDRLFNEKNSALNRAQNYLVSRVPDVKSDWLTISLFEMAFIQNQNLSAELREKIHEALLTRTLTVISKDGSRYIKNTDEKMTFDDQLLLNTMAVSLYASYKDYHTTLDIARWVVSQLELHPQYDTVLDAVLRIDAWLNVDFLFRKQFDSEKFASTIDVYDDSGKMRQHEVDSMHLDITDMSQFTLEKNLVYYSIRGCNLAYIDLIRIYAQPKEQVEEKSLPFQLTQEFTPMSWFSEIKAKTCMSYTPMMKDQKLGIENSNRTMVVEVELPSGTRINVRQIGFLLSRIEQVMYFTYEPCSNKLLFFLNIPSSVFGKPICLEWSLERLSTVMTWSPIQTRVYDYLEQDIQLVQFFPIQFQPTLFGYSFVDAIHKARPSLESLANSQNAKQVLIS